MAVRHGMAGSIARLLVGLALIVLICAGMAGADEFRAFWVDAWGNGFLNQSQVDQLLGIPGNASSLGDIRNANANAVIVQVRRRADVCYPSAMGEPYMSGLSPSNFNALQAMINAAHDTTGGKQRIEVHCWLVTFATGGGTVWNAHNNPADPINYWATLDNSGNPTSDYAFEPGHPKCEEYLTNVCLDMATNFDIDGFHYDYIRYTANNQGYNPTNLARYNTFYGLTGQPAATDPQWQQWRRDQVSAFVRRAYAKVQAVKPNVKVSGSFVTWNPSPTSSTRAGFQATRPYYDVYSDWDSWMQEGIVDMAVPMTYYNWASLPTDYTRWMNFEKDRKFNRHMIVGPGIYLNSLQNACNELIMTRDASPAGNYANGFSGYSYRVPFLSGTWGTFSPSFVSAVCPTKANIPAMPWKTSPTKGHISGTVTIASSGAWADCATVTLAGPENRTMRCDGTGFYAFIDVTPGAYTVTASKSGYPNLQKPVTVAIGSVTGNMYVTDFALGTGSPPPVISNVQATGITTTGATISWTTDQAASSQVQYGLTTSYGSSTTLDNTLVTSHSQSLSGLISGVTYHYHVISTNANGTATSNDYTFTTIGPPVITNVASSAITNNSATVTWTTSQASSSRVEYGLTTGYGSFTTLDNTQVTSHSQGLSGLTQNTLYHYRVISANANGTSTSSDFTLTTSGPPTLTNPLSVNVTANTATITWTTNAPSDGRVNYGLTSSYGSQTVDPNSNVTSHSVGLTGLTPSTTYHYQCVSANVYGTGQTGDLTFATLAPASTYTIDNTDPGWSNTSPNGNAWYSGTNASVPKIGDNYLYYAGDGTTVESSVTRKCRWTPTLTSAGYYDVYVYYQVGSNRNSIAPFTVHYNGGQVTSIQNQYSIVPNQGGWFLVGSNLPFAAGTSGYVEATTLTTNTNLVSADAAKWVLNSPIDTTPPVISSVTDDMYTASTTALAASWSAADPESGISGYECAVGTSPGGVTVKGWTGAGTSTSATITGLSLTVGTTYYISVRATNGVALAATASSSGVTVAQTVEKVADAKLLTDNTPIYLTTTVSAPCSGAFYVEDGSYASGIRVQSSTVVAKDHLVQVYGRLGLANGCERAILTPKVIPGDPGTVVKSRFIVLRDVGGADKNSYTPGISDGKGLYNIGLLARIAGNVDAVVADGFYVNDGSGLEDGSGHLGIKVWTGASDSASPDQTAIVTGPISCFLGEDGKKHPQILSRDITLY